MKKVLFLLLALSYCLIDIAKDTDTSWVEFPEGKLIVKITLKETHAHLVFEDGTKQNIPIDQISTFSIDSKIFKKFPLCINEKGSGQKVFYELVKIEGDLNLYRYSDWSYNPTIKITCYLLFKGEKLILEFDENSKP